jgi:purine-binding chemotaxis protein CheW
MNELPQSKGPHSTRLGGQYLTFLLGEEEYGIPVLEVREIVGVLPITPLPGADPSVLGVVNLRGSVISVIDLRARLGFESAPLSEENCVVVIDATIGGKRTVAGVLVDQVAEVREIEEAGTSRMPELGANIDDTCLLGLGRVAERLVILLDIQQVLERTEFHSAQISA